MSPQPPSFWDMATTLTILLITALATARLTRLVTIDKFCEPFRNWVITKNGDDGWLTYLVFCPYCLSVWIAAALTPLAWFLTSAPDTLGITTWAGLPLTALAVSYLAAIIVTKENA